MDLQLASFLPECLVCVSVCLCVCVRACALKRRAFKIGKAVCAIQSALALSDANFLALLTKLAPPSIKAAGARAGTRRHTTSQSHSHTYIHATRLQSHSMQSCARRHTLSHTHTKSCARRHASCVSTCVLCVRAALCGRQSVAFRARHLVSVAPCVR